MACNPDDIIVVDEDLQTGFNETNLVTLTPVNGASSDRIHRRKEQCPIIDCLLIIMGEHKRIKDI